MDINNKQTENIHPVPASSRTDPTTGTNVDTTDDEATPVNDSPIRQQHQQQQQQAPDRINYPSREGTILSQFYRQPLDTTLSSFSKVANLTKFPYELINHVDDFLKSGNRNNNQQQQRRNNYNHDESINSENFARTLNRNRQASGPNSPIQQEMDTFINQSMGSSPPAYNPSQSLNNYHQISSQDVVVGSPIDRRAYEPFDDRMQNRAPIPVLPPIEAACKRGRLSQLSIEEYEQKFRQTASDLEIIERIFYGGIACDQLRASIWPYLFGIVKERGSFSKIRNSNGQEAYIFAEHEKNMVQWRELKELYETYQKQWKGILPDQETRFSTFRERKSLIERDVIRCDRLHPFYADESPNLNILTDLLMTYMMYDFDIGYVQGMSDLAGPILYLYRGDLIKSFWVFVEVMKLFRRNFELTQKTVHFQLGCLNELVHITDPIFSQYLEENESSNCFFAFRAIVCLFKRELMKENETDYKQVLHLWDTVWCVNLMKKLRDKNPASSGVGDKKEATSADGNLEHPLASSSSSSSSSANPAAAASDPPVADLNFHLFDPNQSDTPRYELTETEVFILALCLSMIRSERDLIMGNQLDCTNIHLHFIDPKLADDLNGFIERAINIFSFLKHDFDLKRLTAPSKYKSTTAGSAGLGDNNRQQGAKAAAAQSGAKAESPGESTEGYDLLTDYLVITGASGT